MININLLPESMRKRESLPRAHFLGILVGLAVLGAMVWTITQYRIVHIPALEQKKKGLEDQKKMLTAETERLKKLNADINRMSGYVDAVKSLYKGRIVWAKILSDIKNIVNFEPSLSTFNADQRYIWITNLNGSAKNLTLKCYATAATQVMAMQMPENFLHTIINYVPSSLPEKDEEERLQIELREAIRTHEEERRERPELPLQGPLEMRIRQRLEEIKTVKSGGIAILPFNDLLAPGSLELKSAQWTSSPKPSGARGQLVEVFPDEAWTFDVVMNLK